ncbi:protein PTHB1 [Zerene cesonia]|uniref:protein PTHB1 n=1 Tax=Zerene cesonia TaxID=33412 RepID=UPI0018E527DA|nr:protein PTHB1 [Zerene cesonia]
MSIFKVKHLWSNEKLQSEHYDEGIQNSYCIKVDKFNSHSDSDCIVVGEGSQLKIYKPNTETPQSQVILESQQNDVILQVETGKFVFDSSDRQILVLHPQSYSIFFLEKREGHVEAGDQNYLKNSIKHSFTRKSYSVIVGPFGNTKSRDLICIQALDGTLSFFDQDAFLFMCIFEDVIIPGPVLYVSSTDFFVISKSTWVLEVYSYQQLGEFSELSARQHKKNIPQWSYSPGEEISSLQVTRTSSNFSSIIALGERYLYCFQDNGLMKYIIRFDFMPVCFHAYLIGWYYEPNSRLLVMVASEDSKLYIYEGTTLLWSCDLMHKTISLSRCFIKNLSGGLVTLSRNGIVHVSYLGTEPDLNSTVAPMNMPAESEDIQAELQDIEEELDKMLENGDSQNFPTEEIINIKTEVGKASKSFIDNNYSERSIINCPLVTTLTCDDPKQIQSIQITYSCTQPFSVVDNTIYLEDINGTEIIETRILLTDEVDISNATIKMLFTVIDCSGKITVLTSNVLVPINFYACVVNIDKEYQCKLYFSMNQTNLSLETIFKDLTDPSSTVTLSYKNTSKLVTIKHMEDHYIIEADEFTEIFPVLQYFVEKLKEHYLNMNIDSCKALFKASPELIKNMTHKFLKCIEVHAKERVILKNLEEELNVLQSQFTLIQKKLLVQYGSLPPGNCDSLEFLMRDTHKSIVTIAKRMLESKDKVSRASLVIICNRSLYCTFTFDSVILSLNYKNYHKYFSAACELSSVGNLTLYIMKCSNPEYSNIKILEETLSFETFHEDIQEWEEAVTQASSYVLNNILKKSDKDKEKLAPVTDQDILSHVNLKRFIKQTKIILEKIFLEVFDQSENERGKEKVTRIEEIVEVI